MHGPTAASTLRGSAPATCCSARTPRPAMPRRVPLHPEWTAAPIPRSGAKRRTGTQSATRTAAANGGRVLQLVRRQLFRGGVARLVDGTRARCARRTLDEHDALAGRVTRFLAVRGEVLHAFQHQPIAVPDHPVRGAGPVAIA